MATSRDSDLRRRLPSVDRLLAEPDAAPLLALYGREAVRVQMRLELEEARTLIIAEQADETQVQNRLTTLFDRLRERLQEALGPPLKRVLNATGVLLHTNLGRAPLPSAVAASLPRKLDAYCDLEISLETGLRGDRNHRVDRLLQSLTGAEAGLVVNNNAAALVLALTTLASQREVIVSRGELVEIGGSFRVPDILRTAGCRLVEVGTTNRTRLADYETATGPETGLLLKVYPSNYRISGFVAEVGPEQLAKLGRHRGVPLLVDEGSGLLRPHKAPQLADHFSFQELLAAGCDLVCGSGDKLLGGPQAGLLAGSRPLVDACRHQPLYRALRPDRMVLTALDEVLRSHLRGSRMPLDGLWPESAAHEARLRRLAETLGADIGSGEAFIGGGSAPERPVVGPVLWLPGDSALLKNLRQGDPPVVASIRQGRLVLDLRTIATEDDDALVEAVLRARAGPPEHHG